MFGRKRRKEEREAAQRAAAEAAAAAARPESAPVAQVPATVGVADSPHGSQATAAAPAVPVLDAPTTAAPIEPAAAERHQAGTHAGTSAGWSDAPRHAEGDHANGLEPSAAEPGPQTVDDRPAHPHSSTDEETDTAPAAAATTPATAPQISGANATFVAPTPPRWTAADFHRGGTPLEGRTENGSRPDGGSTTSSSRDVMPLPEAASPIEPGSSAWGSSTGTSPAGAGSSVSDPVSRGTAGSEVSRGTSTTPSMDDPATLVPPAGAGEGRARRTRPQPVSVADVGAVYTWQTDPESTPGEGESPEPQPVRDEDPEPTSGGTSDVSDGPLPETAVTTGALPDHTPLPGFDSSDDMRSTSTDSVAPATEEDERGTVEDLSDPSLGPVSTGVAVDPDDAARAALVESLPRPGDDTPLMAELQLDARRRIELRGRKFPRPEKTRVITVANQKGGVGKTTTTVNLAAALAQAGLHVLVLDNDPQGNASTALGIDHRAGTPSIYEVLVDGAPMHEAVQESPDVPGLFCLPATIDLSGAEIELVSMVARETRLRTALDNYLTWRIDNGLERIDYVFVDCPPSLGLLTVNAFVVAREVLIPIQCEYYALEGLSQLLKTIDLIQAHLNPQLSVSTILLTMYDARTNLAQQVAEEVRTHFPDRTLRTTVPRSVRISEAPSYGQTVMTYDNGSSGALAYLEAARELAERAEGALTSTDTPSGETVGAAKEDQ